MIIQRVNFIGLTKRGNFSLVLSVLGLRHAGAGGQTFNLHSPPASIGDIDHISERKSSVSSEQHPNR